MGFTQVFDEAIRIIDKGMWGGEDAKQMQMRIYISPGCNVTNLREESFSSNR